jgi:hypothetical protein
VRFSLDIHVVTDGRPDGVVHVAGTGIRHPFTGWVELLGILERQGGGDIDEPNGHHHLRRTNPGRRAD